MARIFDVLAEGGFQCIAPTGPIDQLDIEPHNEETVSRLGYRPFETPRPQSKPIPVQETPNSVSPLFRYFVDGSMRTCNAGYIIDPKRRYLPIFIGQVGVAVISVENKFPQIEKFELKNILLLPDTLADEDIKKASHLIKNSDGKSKMPLELEVDSYKNMIDEQPVNKAREKILSTMHSMEIKVIENLAQSGRLKREALLMIDGALQFYGNLEQKQEAFRNVVGVSKSFNLYTRKGKGPKQVGTIVANLKHEHRTPAYQIEHRNLKIGAWFLRLHSQKNFNGTSLDDGVVKVEVFPESANSPNPVLDRSRCDRISQDILALRHPSTPTTDSRWSSHLYPIHVTERYIKTQFLKDHTISAYL